MLFQKYNNDCGFAVLYIFLKLHHSIDETYEQFLLNFYRKKDLCVKKLIQIANKHNVKLQLSSNNYASKKVKIILYKEHYYLSIFFKDKNLFWCPQNGLTNLSANDLKENAIFLLSDSEYSWIKNFSLFFFIKNHIIKKIFYFSIFLESTVLNLALFIIMRLLFIFLYNANDYYLWVFIGISLLTIFLFILLNYVQSAFVRNVYFDIHKKFFYEKLGILISICLVFLIINLNFSFGLLVLDLLLLIIFIIYFLIRKLTFNKQKFYFLPKFLQIALILLSYILLLKFYLLKIIFLSEVLIFTTALNIFIYNLENLKILLEYFIYKQKNNMK